MNIKGRGKNALDMDLLSQLAMKRQTGKTISQAETKSVLADIRCELQDEFSHSARGLARAGRAIENTLQLALDSGWVRSDKAASMISDFINDETSADGLDGLVKEIRSERRSAPRRTSYSGYRTYTPRRTTSSYGT